MENTFGILAQRWRRLLTTIEYRPTSANSIGQGVIMLHNWKHARAPALQLSYADQEDEQGNVISDSWYQGFQLLVDTSLDVLRHARNKLQRDYLCTNFNSPVGRLLWQDQVCEQVITFL